MPAVSNNTSDSPMDTSPVCSWGLNPSESTVINNSPGNSNTLFLLLSNRHNLCQWTLIQSSVCSVTSTTSLLTDFLVASVDIDARLFGHFNQFYNPAALG